MLQLNVDCLVLIFNELQDEESLHSCLLVNREWCRLVVPILWRRCSWHEINESISNIILSSLPSASKQFLSDNNIRLPTTILLKPPLFNYISFCKFPGKNDIREIIDIMFSNYHYNNHDKRNLIEQEIYKLFISQCKNIERLLWTTSQPLSLFPGASTCFSQLNNLCINVDYMDSNALYEMAQICKDLKELTFYYSQELPGLISLVDAQKNLSKATIFRVFDDNCNTRGSYEELSKALARKSNTISHIHLSLGTITPSFLPSLVNLTQISILSFYDSEYDEVKFQKYLAISEFPNLQSLSFTGLSSCFKEIAILIGKTKGNILRVHISGYETKVPTNTGMLIKSIANNCPKIKFLCIYLKPNDDFVHVKLLLLNCKHLEEIGFGSFNIFMKEDEGDELLDILIKFSPKSLTKITFSRNLRYSTDALERLFESYRERSLDFFDTEHITERHESIVKKYVNEGVIKTFYNL